MKRGLIKTDDEIAVLREGGRRLARILAQLGGALAPGQETRLIDVQARRLIAEAGGEPSLLNYHPVFAKRPYPAAVCVSINDEVVHGIPTENNRVLREGDLVGLDIVMTYKGLMVDTAATFPVGKIDAEAERLLAATREALRAGIGAVSAGARMGDVGHAIEGVGHAHGYGVVHELGGHGVGYRVHEEPMVPNTGKPGTGLELKKNMVLALEPMFNEGTAEVVLDDDGYTYRTADGLRSAHFEHTIVVMEKGADILTHE